MTERSATTPSISDMLEWLQDAERYYRQQYPLCSHLYWLGFVLVVLFISSSTHVFRFLKKKTLLQTVRSDNLSLLESTPEKWKSLESPSADNHITGKCFFIVMLLCKRLCHYN